MKYKQDQPTGNIDDTDIRSLLSSVDIIYIYPHHEITLSDNMLEQTRSGPNWEGGILTLTTCKHLLRSYKSMLVDKTALIGVTNKLRGENYLLYAGIITSVFASNYELGGFLKHYHPEIYNIKLMTNNRLGDIADPHADNLLNDDVYDSLNYKEPCSNHCRIIENDSEGNPKWLKDIEYISRTEARPKCLIMDKNTIHTIPLLKYTGVLGRSGRVYKNDIDKLINDLETVYDN